MRYLPVVLYIGLSVYAFVDIAQHPSAEPYRLPKGVWVLIVLFAPFVGAVAWIISKWVNGGEGRRPRPSSGAPDDDPAFRVWLNEQERRRRHEGRD